MSREAEIAANLLDVQSKIADAASRAGRSADEITLVVVTKTFPVSDLNILYDLGVREFGENRDQEGSVKYELLPKDIRWHFLGQIQSRKIKSISEWASVVHSLDSLAHAAKFPSFKELKPEIKFFVQVNMEPEREDRGGIPLEKVETFLGDLRDLHTINPIGLMCVAPIDQAPSQVFAQVAMKSQELQSEFPSLGALSMGMSGDFDAAIAAGATHLRIGSSILGSRIQMT